MANILMWTGIAVTVIGWLALAWQASKAITSKDELDKFPEKKQTMLLHRNYCRFTIIAGILILIIAMII